MIDAGYVTLRVIDAAASRKAYVKELVWRVAAAGTIEW